MTTNQPGGPLRKDPMTGTLDGFHTAARAALRQRDRERLHNIARPTERAAAEARLHLALGRALGDVRAADREEVARLKRELADARRQLKEARAGAQAFAKDLTEAGEQLAACQADYEKRIAGLEDELTETQAAAQELRDELAAMQQVASGRLAELHQAEHTITELQGQAATHECMPLPQRQKPAPEPNPDPPAPAGVALDGAESHGDATKGPIRSPGRARASRGRRNDPGGSA